MVAPAFVAGLEYATGVDAVVVGKPSPEMFQAALRDLGLAPADVVMIGDDIRQDVGGAQKAGIRGVLVKTGKYRPELNARAVTPDLVLDSIATLKLVAFLEKEFDITIEAHEADAQNLDTLEDITRLVASKR